MTNEKDKPTLRAGQAAFTAILETARTALDVIQSNPASPAAAQAMVALEAARATLEKAASGG